MDINGNPLPPSPGKIVLGTAVAEEGGEDDDDDEEDGEEYDDEEDEDDEEWEEFVMPEDDQRPSSSRCRHQTLPHPITNTNQLPQTLVSSRRRRPHRACPAKRD